MPINEYMPQYQCWSESDFQSDRHVQRMPYPSRRLYRALLQAAFVCATRPYLPVEDEELYLLAEADDIEYWLQHKEPVLRMFTRITGEGGQELLERKRLTRDWNQMMEGVNNKRKAGRARHSKSTGAEHAAAGALKLKPETKVKPEMKLKRNETETDSASGSGSVAIDSTDRQQLSTDDTRADELSEMWTNLSGTTGSPVDFAAILDSYTEGEDPIPECMDLMHWAINVSNHWPAALVNSRSFKNAYETIRGQRDRYLSAAAANKKLAEDPRTEDDAMFDAAFEMKDELD